MARWRLNEAQKHLPEIVEKALTEGPQTIALPRGRSVTVSGSPRVRKTRRPSKGKPKRRPTVVEMLLAAPHVPEFNIPRSDDYPIAPTFE